MLSWESQLIRSQLIFVTRKQQKGGRTRSVTSQFPRNLLCPEKCQPGISGGKLLDNLNVLYCRYLSLCWTDIDVKDATCWTLVSFSSQQISQIKIFHFDKNISKKSLKVFQLWIVRNIWPEDCAVLHHLQIFSMSVCREKRGVRPARAIVTFSQNYTFPCRMMMEWG